MRQNSTTHDLKSNSLSTSQQISFLWRKYQTFHPYVLLLLLLCFFDGVCIDFPRFSHYHPQPTTSTTTTTKAHKINKTSNGKKFLFFMIISCALKIVQCVFISTIQKMQHTHQYMCNYILCTSISYVSCNAFFFGMRFSLLAQALYFFLSFLILLQINI